MNMQPDTFLQFGAFGLVSFAFFYGVKALDKLINAAVESMKGMTVTMQSMAAGMIEMKSELENFRAEFRQKLPTLREKEE